MSNQDLRLRYILDLASNVGVKAKQEAAVFEEASRRMTTATGKTSRQVTDLDRNVDALGKTTERSHRQATVMDRVLERMGKSADRAKRDTDALERALQDLGNNTSTQRQVAYMERLAQGIDRASDRARQLKQHMANGMDKLPEMAAGATAGYYGGKAVLAPPMRAYADLEAATMDLKIAMTDAKGNLNKAFGGISKEALALGNQLPGSTKDFMGAAEALIRQGVAPEVVEKGGLRASSYFGVLMGMNQAQSAETIAKVKEASGLQGNELVPMADLMQRGSYAFGIKPTDYLEVAKYAAPTYNTMGTTGLENAKKMLALQGMAASVGLEASAFGTNIAQMMNRLSQVDGKQNKNSAEARAMKALLHEQGIGLSFYDDKGQFKGVENMLTELAQLRKLSPVQQQRTIHQLFGDEGGRPAQTLVQKGIEEYRANLAKLEAQAGIDQRITMKMDTFAAKLEALGGTIENVMARMATQIGEASKPALDGGNSILGQAGDFFSEHPGVGTAVLGTAALGASLLARRSVGGLWSRLGAGLRGGASAAPAATAFRGTTMMDAIRFNEAAAARTSALSRVVGMGRYLGPAAAAGGLVLDSYDAITDDRLTAMGKARGVGLALSGAGGAWGGAAAGAALGSVVPGVGTFIGGVAGGLMGYYGMRSVAGSVWQEDRERDFVRLTAPGAISMGGLSAGGHTTLELGEGRLQVDVVVRQDGSSSVSTSLLSPLPLIRVEAGATNPGSFAAMTGGGF